MAISTDAMTLAQYALLANDPLITRVVFTLREAGAAWTDVPFVTRPTMKVNGSRWAGNLPGVNWVKLNSPPTVVSGEPSQFQEQAFIIRNSIEVDRNLVEDQNQIMDPRAAQTEAWLYSLAYDLNDKYINNNHVTGDTNAIVGLRERLDKAATYGTVAASSGAASANKIDAGGLDLSVGGATAATANQFLRLLDRVLYAVKALDGTGVVIYMNNDLLIQLPYLIRLMGNGAGFATTKDAYDRDVTTYRGAIFKDIGLKADQSTPIITSTETSAGANGSSTYTSLYAVRYGENYVMGWQFRPLEVKNYPLDPTNNVIYRTTFDWTGGLVATDPRSMARLFGMKIS